MQKFMELNNRGYFRKNVLNPLIKGNLLMLTIQLMLTIPNGYNTRILKDKEKYKFFYCKKELYEIGKLKLKSPYGNEITVYDKERTICDCLRKKDKMDMDLVLTAVKQYMREPGADFARLLKYAELFHVREMVRQYVEVLS